jgi:hypothetical protein
MLQGRLAHVSFHQLLACLCDSFANLEAHLRCGIVDEASEARAECAIDTLVRLWLVRVPITVGGLLLLLRDRRRRGSHHRNGRHMLGNWVV